jgi:hypothetical protein
MASWRKAYLEENRKRFLLIDELRELKREKKKMYNFIHLESIEKQKLINKARDCDVILGSLVNYLKQEINTDN